MTGVSRFLGTVHAPHSLSNSEPSTHFPDLDHSSTVSLIPSDFLRVNLCNAVVLLGLLLLVSCHHRDSWPPKVQDVPENAPVYSPGEALDTFFLPPGYDLELVAAEPLVKDPVEIEFDAKGRMWVVEMRTYMPSTEGEGEGQPRGKIVVLDDTTGNGRMDTRTVYMDHLVLPRAIQVLDDGALVGEPPHLWLTRDTTGHLGVDEKRALREDYGNPEQNPEHNANGLLWGLDNWIHNAKYDGRLRSRNSAWTYDETLRLGQWGVSMDDYGRIYRNYNSDPLHVDLVPAHYYERNENLPEDRFRGVYVSTETSETVWPVRPTPGVNRGYRGGLLREDTTLKQFTAAGSPVVYRGDQLPATLRNDVFVSEPAGNLVRRFQMTEREDGTLVGRNPYEEAEFIASTDERFRPVNFASGPDGTLYVVDMHRGLIQHKDYLTGYLKTYIEEHGLEKPIGLGRIYRVVHRTTESVPEPNLDRKSPKELAAVLSHPNGWWRDTAQRLLVEREATTATPALRRLVTSGDSTYARLHALWTLDGLGAAGPSIIKQSLADPSPHVRAAALRIGEPFLAQSQNALVDSVLGLLDDSAPAVRRQLAASLGERPLPDRTDVLLDVLGRHATDPIVVSLVASGLAGHEVPFLERLLAHTEDAPPTAGVKDAVETLVATVMNGGEPRETQTVLGWVGEDARPTWHRLAVLHGVGAVAPEAEDPQIERLELDYKPHQFLAAKTADSDTVRTRARAVAGRLGWPGKPTPERPEVSPLTAAEQQLFERGRQQYAANCAECHGKKGRGLERVAPSLVGSGLALGDEERLVRIILHGLEGDRLMPPAKQRLSDGKIAEIATFIRRAWGNEASAVDTSTVLEVRGETMGRSEPYVRSEVLEE